MLNRTRSGGRTSSPTERSPSERLTEVAALLRRLRHVASLGERMRRIARLLRGRPYVVNPLGGGPDRPEVLTLELAGFDCVTYVETVLALALAGSVREVPDLLRRMRYREGRLDWRARHHYMIEWIRENVRQGLVRNLTRGPGTRLLTRRVDVVPGLRPRTLRFRCFFKKALPRVRERIRDGDLIFFVSTRPWLDIFHVGLLFVESESARAEGQTPRPRLILSHASRRQGCVLEQDLEEFLKENRMSGFLLVRPQAREGSAMPSRDRLKGSAPTPSARASTQAPGPRERRHDSGGHKRGIADGGKWRSRTDASLG